MKKIFESEIEEQSEFAELPTGCYVSFISTYINQIQIVHSRRLSLLFVGVCHIDDFHRQKVAAMSLRFYGS